jgi:hypothetical protein
MSQVSVLAETSHTVDWSVVAGAVAVFCGTVVTTIWGWIQGKKKIDQHFKTNPGSPEGTGQVTGAILMDNLTIRESTLVNREVRDQLILQHHCLSDLRQAMIDNTRAMDDLLQELRHHRKR